MYKYEIQQREQYTIPRGASGSRRKGGRKCGTFHGERWKQRAVTDDLGAAKEYIAGLGDDWRIFDHSVDAVV